DLVAEKRSERVGRGGLEVVKMLKGVVDRALARRVPRGVECHCRERVRERGEEAGGPAHNPLPRSPASAAARISGACDAAARRNTARTRGSWCHPLASPATAARSSADWGGRFRRP